MATGAPDWQGQRWKIEATTRPNLIHPSGKLFFMDLFDFPGLAWTTSTGNGGTATIDTAKKFTGECSLKMTIDDQANSYARINKYLGLPPTKKIGFETHFTITDTVDVQFDFQLNYYDGTNLTQAQISWKDDGNVWAYMNSAGTLTNIPNGTQDFFRGFQSWQHMKFVVDFNENKYVRLFSNDLSLDLSDLALYQTRDPTKPNLNISIYFSQTTAAEERLYLDQIIITEE